MTEELSPEDIKKRTRSRQVLVFMVALFALPYIASLSLWQFGDKFNLGTTNYGDLLKERVHLSKIGFQTLDNNPVDVSAYKGKWLLLAIGSSDCDDLCKGSLYKMRQIRKLMAVDRAWIKRAYAITDQGDLTALQAFMQDYDGTEIFTISTEVKKSIQQQLNIETGTVANRMLLIDPHGDIILVYPQDPDPKGIHGDIEKLFKITKRE